jgi:putative FmdB family regulatory protein
MPIYEYRCVACGHHVEQLQKADDPAPEPCPSCGDPKPLERLMSRSSFQLKGGGWYSDLYSSQKKGSDAPTENSGAVPASPAGGAPSTAAPAVAAPTKAASATPSTASSGAGATSGPSGTSGSSS